MKTNPLIIVVAAISLAGVANAEEKRKPIRPDNRVEIPEGQKGPRHPDRPLPPEMMQKFDKDGDGKLNEEERAAAKEAMKGREEAYRKEMLEKFDKDGDGKLSEEEHEAAKKERMEKHEARKKELLAKYDKDGDGELSEDEKKAIQKDLIGDKTKQFDKDGDGKLNEAEKEAMKKAMRENHEKRGGPKGPGGPDKRPKDGEGDGNPGVLGE